MVLAKTYSKIVLLEKKTVERITPYFFLPLYSMDKDNFNPLKGCLQSRRISGGSNHVISEFKHINYLERLRRLVLLSFRRRKDRTVAFTSISIFSLLGRFFPNTSIFQREGHPFNLTEPEVRTLSQCLSCHSLAFPVSKSA